MENKNSMREMIAQIAKGAEQSAEVVQGTVISGSPIKISLVNDAKVILTSTDLIVPQHLSSYSVSADISGGSVSGSVSAHNHRSVTLKINNSLQSGDKVHLLSFNNGKKYFVLDKV